ncbi:nucleotide-diphospho-sugar transferase [Favolaschia claudopus]|uniref:Dolichol-phosphate mannosyltransferase subunit 1 n=1 Tax=Favolaschia claudopus TaxID=2862362 RepID=A0AAV9Z312_9AGAR
MASRGEVDTSAIRQQDRESLPVLKQQDTSAQPGVAKNRHGGEGKKSSAETPRTNLMAIRSCCHSVTLLQLNHHHHRSLASGFNAGAAHNRKKHAIGYDMLFASLRMLRRPGMRLRYYLQRISMFDVSLIMTTEFFSTEIRRISQSSNGPKASAKGVTTSAIRSHGILVIDDPIIDRVADKHNHTTPPRKHFPHRPSPPSPSPTLSSLRRSLPAWARDRRLPRPLTSGPLPTFLFLLFCSLLLTPSPALYTPHDSAKYTPPPHPASGPPITTSIIVPTFHERANLAALVTTTYAALPPLLAKETEFVFVDDDSGDGTEEEVERLRGEGYGNLQLLVRPRGGGEKGLSSAVIRGFERARGTRLVVMDADLQHPPKAIPQLLDALEDSTSPMALGTRYGPGVSMDRNWPLYRRVISWGARMLARPLTTASDPMTGFFALRKEAFEGSAPLSPMGFKIALELLLSVPKASRPPEVPYAFGVRTQGASKLGAKVIVKYILQLTHLYRRALGFFWHVLVAEGAGAEEEREVDGEEGWGWAVAAVSGRDSEE